MPRVCALTVQTLWDCRWSRPGNPVTRSNEAPRNGSPSTADDDSPGPGSASTARREPGTHWVCIREGGQRAVTEAECELCEHWEATNNIDERDERG